MPCKYQIQPGKSSINNQYPWGKSGHVREGLDPYIYPNHVFMDPPKHVLEAEYALYGVDKRCPGYAGPGTWRWVCTRKEGHQGLHVGHCDAVVIAWWM